MLETKSTTNNLKMEYLKLGLGFQITEIIYKHKSEGCNIL